MRLLERSDTLASLQALLAQVEATGEGRLVLVGGEAGVGKTALVRGSTERVEARVLWGACEPLRTPRPLGPFLGFAEELADARPHEVAAALIRRLRGTLTVLMLEHVHWADEATLDVLTVLVLEAVHWADEATLDVLTLLATRIAAAPALALATYRDEEPARPDQLRFVLGELVRGRIKVEPLSPSAGRRRRGAARRAGVPPPARRRAGRGRRAARALAPAVLRRPHARGRAAHARGGRAARALPARPRARDDLRERRAAPMTVERREEAIA